MEKEFLESLGIEETAVAAILAESQKADESHQKELAQMRFDHALEQAVLGAGGKNLTAIRALLDLEALTAAEDPGKAVCAALKDLKKECGYLFESQMPPAYATGTGTRQTPAVDDPKSLADALREKFKKR